MVSLRVGGDEASSMAALARRSEPQTGLLLQLVVVAVDHDLVRWCLAHYLNAKWCCEAVKNGDLGDADTGLLGILRRHML